MREQATNGHAKEHRVITQELSHHTSIIHSIIKAIEDTLKLHIAINDYTGCFYKFIPINNSFHCNLCCMEVKRFFHNNELCRRFDTVDIPQKLQTVRKGIIKKCHVGIFEMAYPIVNGEILMGTIFLGPYRISDSTNIAYISQNRVDEQDATNQKFIQTQIPTLSSYQASSLFILADILCDRLGTELLEAIVKTSNEEMSRKSRVSRFISMNFSRQIKLDDLARLLSLSSSRLSEVIRTEFGCSFPDLLNDYRVNHAKQLLTSSDFTIEAISERCGFSDATYFHKIFKTKTGETQKKYRQIHKQTMIA